MDPRDRGHDAERADDAPGLTRGSDAALTVQDLTALHEVAVRVNAVLLPEEIHAEVLAGAVELLRADSGSIRLRVGDRLAVAAAVGAAPRIGSASRVDDDPAVVVVTLGTVLHEDDPPRLSVPMTVGARHVGVLEVVRSAGSPPFAERQLLLARLFAEEAVTAFVNANRYDVERSRADDAEAVSVDRSDAVADTVHDLRSPLAGLMGYAQLLRDRHDDLTPEKRATIVEFLCDEAARLETMVEQVFNAAAGEARAAHVREPVDLGAVVRRVATAVGAAHEASDRPVTIELDLADGAIVLGDEESLTRVVDNLVANAAEHGGPQVLVRVQRRGGEVRLHVADRGPGIAHERLQRLFRGGFAPDGSPRGRGLVIIDGLVRGLGGRVGVRSQPGVGSVFTVRLPAAGAA